MCTARSSHSFHHTFEREVWAGASFEPTFLFISQFLFANRGRSEYFQLPQRTIEASNALAHDSDASRQNNSIFFFFPPPSSSVRLASETHPPKERKNKKSRNKKWGNRTHLGGHHSLFLCPACRKLEIFLRFSHDEPPQRQLRSSTVDHTVFFFFTIE